MPCSPTDLANSGILLIADGTDNGTRPFADGDNHVYWTNPSIVLSGGIDAGTARVGVQNTVTVTVTNISGQALSDINVEAWVCDFTMGVSPSSALPSSNPGGAAMTGYFAGPLAPSGSHPISVAPVWTPTAGDAALNGGHVCIAANCYGDPPDKSLTLADEGNTFNFLCNSHHAQRNIAVRMVSGGMKRLVFPMVVTNPTPRLGNTTLAEIEWQTGPRAWIGLPQTLKTHPGIIAATVLPNVVLSGDPHQTFSQDMLRIESPVAPTTVGVTQEFRNRFFLPIDEKTHVPLKLSPQSPRNFTIGSEGFGTGRSLQFDLAQGQKKPLIVSLNLDPGHRPGDTQVFDLVQRTPAGAVVGGARLIVIVQP
jgi:hypothetical protein